MSDRADEVAQKVAREFFAVCPPPDATWFVEAAMIPLLSDIVVAALRAYAEEVRREES